MPAHALSHQRSRDERDGLLSPAAFAAAIERCDRLLRTVRAAVRTRAGSPLATASVGLALAPGLEPGAGALLDGVHRAMRTAQREGGDQWAAA
jgi:GGDEF domain-containing protein